MSEILFIIMVFKKVPVFSGMIIRVSLKKYNDFELIITNYKTTGK